MQTFFYLGLGAYSFKNFLIIVEDAKVFFKKRRFNYRTIQKFFKKAKGNTLRQCEPPPELVRRSLEEC